MKYCFEFKFRGKKLVFGLNDLSIPSIQINKNKKSELAFALFRSEVLVLILGALMSAILEVVGILYSFCEFSGKQKEITQKRYRTFINSSWGIFEQNIRVVIFWTLCHLSLGHEKKALLRDLVDQQWISGHQYFLGYTSKTSTEHDLRKLFKKHKTGPPKIDGGKT